LSPIPAGRLSGQLIRKSEEHRATFHATVPAAGVEAQVKAGDVLASSEARKRNSASEPTALGSMCGIGIACKAANAFSAPSGWFLQAGVERLADAVVLQQADRAGVYRADQVDISSVGENARQRKVVPRADARLPEYDFQPRPSASISLTICARFSGVASGQGTLALYSQRSAAVTSAPAIVSRITWLRSWPPAVPVMNETLPSSLPILNPSGVVRVDGAAHSAAGRPATTGS
jgi:hypothetical protein